jgi:hypothetical protein
VAMTVLLLDGTDGEFSFCPELVSQLARLGVTNVALVRDEQTVGIVLEGWLFDPERSADAAAEAIKATPAARTLRPVMNVAVAAAAGKGG